MEFCLDLCLYKLQKEEAKSSASNSPKNKAISPFGINVILHMITDGFNGATLNQLLQTLKLQSVDDLVPQAKKLMQLAKSSSRKENPVICNFNAVLVDQPFCLNKKHRDFVENVFNAKVKSLDFGHEDAVAEVNGWAKEETKGYIDPLLHFDSFRETAILIHANGLYFSGMWEDEFCESNTQNEKFHLLDGVKTVDAPFMKKHETYNTAASFDHYDVLNIPYRVTDFESPRRFSMIIILPKNKTGLPKLVKKFRESPHLLSNEHLNLTPTIIKQLWIPRFKFKYDFTPSDEMKELGLTLMFTYNNEINGRVDDDDAQPYVSRIMQHTKIECNEKGTKVISCTVESEDEMGISFYSSPPRLPIMDFIADHPFMFMIKENVSDTIFFLGAIYNPLGEEDEPATFEMTAFRGFEDEESDDDEDMYRITNYNGSNVESNDDLNMAVID